MMRAAVFRIVAGFPLFKESGEHTRLSFRVTSLDIIGYPASGAIFGRDIARWVGGRGAPPHLDVRRPPPAAIANASNHEPSGGAGAAATGALSAAAAHTLAAAAPVCNGTACSVGGFVLQECILRLHPLPDATSQHTLTMNPFLHPDRLADPTTMSVKERRFALYYFCTRNLRCFWRRKSIPPASLCSCGNSRTIP